MSGSATVDEHERMHEGTDFLITMAVPGPDTQALLEVVAALAGDRLNR